MTRNSTHIDRIIFTTSNFRRENACNIEILRKSYINMLQIFSIQALLKMISRNTWKQAEFQLALQDQDYITNSNRYFIKFLAALSKKRKICKIIYRSY